MSSNTESTLIAAPRIAAFTLSAKAVWIASTLMALKRPGLHILVADSKKNAYFLSSDLYNFFGDDTVFLFPASTDKSETKTATAKVQRTAALSVVTAMKDAGKPDDQADFEAALAQATFNLAALNASSSTPAKVLVTYPEALAEKVLKKSKTRASILQISRGEKLSHGFITELLFENGFKRADFVSEPGEFAVRGGLIDIFSFSDNQPYRIDFFGEEVDSIRRFDVNTQFSTTELERVEIFPDLTQNHAESDFIDFVTILPKGTVRWDLTEAELATPSEAMVIPQPTFNKNFEILAGDIEEKLAEGYTVTILSPNESQTLRLQQILRDIGTGARPRFLPLSLHEGYIDKSTRNCFYTDHQIFERYHKIKVRRQVEKSERLTINDLTSMQLGDYVVHIDHGVGRFGGLVKTHIGGRVQEAIKLEYRDNDVIFVSIHGIHRISKYRSRDDEPPKIYKLGSKAWENLKSATKAKVKDIAKDLIQLYSQRQQSQGFAFSADTYLQQELESSFLFEDTPDQVKATLAVKEDMESIHPMDRLICGDVGFGKTEIAVRAAFKAVCDSKQVAVLVPTTILALQHYKTFSERLKNFPCRVEYLSRLRTAKDIKEIQADLEAGKIDILIGTHRLLNKTVKFKDLGLLIIDEEQKFGVTAKERLRQLKASVDTLTLTATPIPRTLQFSLLGARDLSIINTPPPNRLPVYTEVIHFEDDIIADIINRELERGGQVFFVHNRVEDILSIREILHRLVPEADICVAHGQMDPQELEQRMLDFINGDYDILLSTSIMENGIDIPNANTIIINQAQRFGLSDLHQLRGRVGRSNVKAYCYLVIPSMDGITEEAHRRIKAIEAFSDLGSGFNIAMQDLDIRGAGNLLGAEQSGFIAEMGFETYMRILNEAMAELPETIRQEEQANIKHRKEGITAADLPQIFMSEIDTQVETDMEILIPDDYVNVPSEKIRLYRELDNLSREADLEKFARGLEDRFGPIPEPVAALMDVVRLRREAQKIGIERVVLKKNMMLAYFIQNPMSNFFETKTFERVLDNVARAGNRYSVVQNETRLYLKSVGVTTVARAVQLLRNLATGTEESPL